MTKTNIERSKEIVEAFKNVNRALIYSLCLPKEMTINELAEQLKISYKSTYLNVAYLETLNLVKRLTVKLPNNAYGYAIKSIPLEPELNELYLLALEKQVAIDESLQRIKDLLDKKFPQDNTTKQNG